MTQMTNYGESTHVGKSGRSGVVTILYEESVVFQVFLFAAVTTLVLSTVTRGTSGKFTPAGTPEPGTTSMYEVVKSEHFS